MRIILVLLLSTICFMVSCKKEIQEPQTQTHKIPEPFYPDPGTWKVSNKTFTKQTSKWYKGWDSLYTISFNDGNENSIHIGFYNKPEDSGTYRIVDAPDQDDEVAIVEWQKNGGGATSEDELGGTLYVTVEPNGKLTYKATWFELQLSTFSFSYNVDCSFYLTED